MTIRCLAVDDEAYASEIIANYIKKTPFLELVGTTTNAFEALNMVQEAKVDLIFLDIQMPELTGIQFLKICGGKCKVVLTTAYPEYALEGFEHDVVDYLLKPVSYDRFYKAALKVQQQLDKPVMQVPAAVETAPANTADFIFIKGDTKNKFIKIKYSDILYIEGLKNYVSIFTAADQRLITYQSLRELETILPKQSFYRIHKSYIVSAEHIKMIDGNTVFIKDQALPIGETYRDDFFKMIRESN